MKGETCERTPSLVWHWQRPVPVAAGQHTKTSQENEKLKAQVLQLQKDNGELGNRIDTLTKEKTDLRAENERLKTKHPTKKRKHRRTASRHVTSG
jgi:predicted RNase H-like nuclease (RuvC/YqgF family)